MLIRGQRTLNSRTLVPARYVCERLSLVIIVKEQTRSPLAFAHRRKCRHNRLNKVIEFRKSVPSSRRRHARLLLGLRYLEGRCAELLHAVLRLRTRKLLRRCGLTLRHPEGRCAELLLALLRLRCWESLRRCRLTLRWIEGRCAELLHALLRRRCGGLLLDQRGLTLWQLEGRRVRLLHALLRVRC
jgi:hypothetical protein